MRRAVLTRFIVVCLIAVVAAACAGPERHAVPAALVSKAQVPVTGATRFWGDEVPKDIIAFVQTHMPSVQRMAAGANVKNGRPHVAWMGSKLAEPRAPGKEAPMLYTRLNDDGTAFEPQRNVIQHAVGLDGGGSVAADAAGNVHVAWHADVPGRKTGPTTR